MRNMRRISEKFEFSLDGRQISLLFFLIVLLIGLSFSVGVMYGKGLRKIEKPKLVAEQEKPPDVLSGYEQAPDAQLTQLPHAGSPESEKQEVYTFYESLTKMEQEIIPPVEVKKQKEEKEKETEKVIKPLPKGEYSIQVVAYNDRDRARAMVKRLKSKGFNAFIEEGKSGGKRIFRVKIGYYNSKDEAEEVARELKRKEGLSGFITK